MNELPDSDHGHYGFRPIGGTILQVVTFYLTKGLGH